MKPVPTTTTQPPVDDMQQVVHSGSLPADTPSGQTPTSGAPPDKARHFQTQVVFIHGLWLHATSWCKWLGYFRAAGFAVRAPGWPDFPATVAQTRDHPEFMIDQTVDQVVEHYAEIVRQLPTKPVLIGHSFGGLVAQKLLDRDLARAVVSIDPAPVRGVLRVPLAQLRASLPVLGNPLTVHRAISLSPKQFHYSFANQLTEAEAATLYYDWTIPAPARPLWQAAVANLTPHAQTSVDLYKARAPLLLMAGTEDHTMPAQTTRTVQQLYGHAPATTDLKEWPGRGHSLVIDNGWRELADYTLEWLGARGIR
jgi:pimeloyl-ACP methyl ester carboxylesterase